jgi:N-acetyl-alpha-D-glucosaminyl L-malate synthase BshA
LKIGISCYPTVGGSGILATRLGLELAKRGNEVHFITYERPVMMHGMDQENVMVHLVSVVEYPLFKYPPYTVALGSEMIRVSEQYGLDMIHVHYTIPHATAALLARMVTGVPYMATIHGSDVTIMGEDPSYSPVNTFSIESADRLTSVSQYLAKEARERLGVRKEIAVIPNFVDPDAFSPPNSEAAAHGNNQATIVHVSNFRPVKRVQDIVEAMGIVVKEIKDARLILVGDGPERHKTELLVDRLGLQKNVRFTGYRRDIPPLMRCSSIFVLSSESESAPLTLLEGMSCGLPVVSTRVGGVPEIVSDGENGFLVPPYSPNMIAEKILELGNDDELRRRLGAAARRTVLERFTAKMVLPQYEKLYRELMK